MSREIVQSIVNEHGGEQHPAFGLIGAYRTQNGPPGATLFDSDIQHQHTVVVKISTAARRRDLNHDRIYARQEFVEVEMSEAQWASFVSSMNTGDGVPCTIRRREDDFQVSGVPYQPRMAESMKEVYGASQKAVEAVAAALATYKAHKTSANLRSLQATVDNLPSNMRFAASSMSEHAENVVQRTRADMEAIVLAMAERVGLPSRDLGFHPTLGRGEAE